MTPTEEINEWITKYGSERDALNVAIGRLAGLERAFAAYRAAVSSDEAVQTITRMVQEQETHLNMISHEQHERRKLIDIAATLKNRAEAAEAKLAEAEARNTRLIEALR